MSDTLKSMIRTFVPVVVGLIIAALATVGIELDPGPLTAVIDALFVGAYYALIRFLETRFPSAGWFLGLPATPSYAEAPKEG